MDKAIERALGAALFVALLVVLYGVLQVPLLRFANQIANQPATTQADTVDAPRGSSINEFTLASATLHRTLPVRVYLPPSSAALYTKPPIVVYFLHGTPGDYRDWLDLGNVKSYLDDAIQKGDLPPIVAVFPEVDNQPNQATEFVNRRDGNAAVMDYVTTELPQVIESRYAVSRTTRALVGNSEGGYGAINIAARHPDRFQFAASLSGYFIARDMPENDFVFGHDSAYARIQSPLYWIADQPAAKMPNLYLVSESNDEFGKSLQDFQRVLVTHKVPADIQLVDGVHGWEFWRSQIPGVFTWLGAKLKPLYQ